MLVWLELLLVESFFEVTTQFFRVGTRLPTVGLTPCETIDDPTDDDRVEDGLPPRRWLAPSLACVKSMNWSRSRSPVFARDVCCDPGTPTVGLILFTPLVGRRRESPGDAPAVVNGGFPGTPCPGSVASKEEDD